MEEQRLESFVRIQKLKFFGYLNRSLGVGKIVLEGTINWKRERGRPRRECETDIRDAFNKPITEVGRLALDRERFRSMIKHATFNRISSS